MLIVFLHVVGEPPESLTGADETNLLTDDGGKSVDGLSYVPDDLGKIYLKMVLIL